MAPKERENSLTSRRPLLLLTGVSSTRHDIRGKTWFCFHQNATIEKLREWLGREATEERKLRNKERGEELWYLGLVQVRGGASSEGRHVVGDGRRDAGGRRRRRRRRGHYQPRMNPLSPAASAKSFCFGATSTNETERAQNDLKSNTQKNLQS